MSSKYTQCFQYVIFLEILCFVIMSFQFQASQQASREHQLLVGRLTNLETRMAKHDARVGQVKKNPRSTKKTGSNPFCSHEYRTRHDKAYTKRVLPIRRRIGYGTPAESTCRRTHHEKGQSSLEWAGHGRKYIEVHILMESRLVMSIYI